MAELLKEWERFAAQLLESYLSYPVLAYYRSQHDDQNWLKSLTAIMDACALISVGLEESQEWELSLQFQARSTFAMGRHVLVDLAYILDAAPRAPQPERLSADAQKSMFEVLDRSGLRLNRSPEAIAAFLATRELYEPFAEGLSRELIMDIPQWISREHVKDNWETTAWDGAKHF
jgi:hypothetical protein